MGCAGVGPELELPLKHEIMAILGFATFTEISNSKKLDFF